MSATDIQYNYTNIILLINTMRCGVSCHDQSSYFITFPSIFIKMSITKFLKIKITAILFSIRTIFQLFHVNYFEKNLLYFQTIFLHEKYFHKSYFVRRVGHIWCKFLIFLYRLISNFFNRINFEYINRFIL